jgi:hypothetical protein
MSAEIHSPISINTSAPSTKKSDPLPKKKNWHPFEIRIQAIEYIANKSNKFEGSQSGKASYVSLV